MISLEVKFNAKSHNKRSNLGNVIEVLQKIKESVDSLDTVYICADIE